MINTNLAFLHYPLAEKLGRYIKGNKGSFTDSRRQKTTERGKKERDRDREREKVIMVHFCPASIMALGKTLMVKLFGFQLPKPITEDLSPGFQLWKPFWFIQSKIYLSYQKKLFEEHFGMYPIINPYTCVGTKKSRALIL
jgi:hypothetical protein